MNGETRILELRAENFKRLRAVHVRPDGALVVIGGRNAQGKSSTLDAIWAALGGGKAVPGVAVRQGAAKGLAEVTLDNGLIVRRTFTSAGGGTLTVTDAEGRKYPSPQAMLDGLVSSLSFDPLDFLRQRPREQGETLRAVTGLDLADLDGRRKAAYDERTEVNRDLRAAEARLAGLAPQTDAPAEEQSTAALVAQADAARTINRANAERREGVAKIVAQVEQTRREVAEIDAEIRRLAERREAVVVRGKAEAERWAQALAEVAVLSDVPVPDVAAAVAQVEAVNRQVRANRHRAEAEAAATQVRARSGALTAEIDRLDAERAALIAGAAMPVPGLGLDPDGSVLLSGLPFGQASQAEQLRVSVAIGAALNPRLRVLLVRDGSLLDADNLEALAQQAEAAGLQVWIERVGEGEECGVVIEDGSVREPVQP